MSNPIARSLRAKATLGAVLPLVVILGLLTAIDHSRHEKTTFNNLSFLASQTSRVIENSLQHEMLSENPEGLQQLLDAIGEDETIRILFLMDINGRVVFAPGGEGVGSVLDNRDKSCQPCHRLPAEARATSVVVSLPDGQRVFRSMNPIENHPQCQACHAASEPVVGLLLTDISMAPLESQLAADLRENLLWWAVTILSTAVVVNLAMSRLVIQRLELVAQTLTRFGRGALDLRLSMDSPDEIGQLASAFNEMGRRIQAEEAQNRTLSEDLRRQGTQRKELLKRLITAQEEERRRVARDLHDDLGQDLAGLGVQIEAIERRWADQPEQARAQLRNARGLIADATQRTYAMILALRPSSLDDLGLVPALRAHAERVLHEAGIQLELDSRQLNRRLPPEIETALFRTVQEALNNVVRHSGARRVLVTVAARGGMFEGTIEDDGRGFNVGEVQINGHGPRGLGLLGMRERVSQCDGTLEIDSRPGSGTCLRIRIPIPEVAGD